MSSSKFHRNIVILGSTGSVGRNAVQEILDHPDEFTVVGLVAKDNLPLLAEQASALHARFALTTDSRRLDDLARLIPPDCQALAGEDALLDLVAREEVELVLCAIVGTAGINAALAALAMGKTLALASKEILCLAGELVLKAAKASTGGLVPVDSEHSALFQCLQGRQPQEIAKLWLTASGGPFRDLSRDQLTAVTVKQALEHPNWSMGRKVTVDSASLMNKALELIEAHYLFSVPESKLGAVLHRQSKVHALVELIDGTLIAQLSAPDMRMPIRYALSYPCRLPGHATRMSPLDIGQLDFAPIDELKFPALNLARQAIKAGGTMPAVLSAANDVAVEAFLAGKLPFTRIWDVVAKTMETFSTEPQQDLKQMLDIDASARARAKSYIARA